MPRRKAAGRKRKQHTEAEPGVLEEKRHDQEGKDKLSVDHADIDKENNSQDCNAMVDQVLKKYKLCERAAPNPELASVDAPRRTEGEQTPQNSGDGTLLPHGSNGSGVQDNSSVDVATLLPDPGRCSRRMASHRKSGPPDGDAGPDPGRSSTKVASLRKRTLTSVSSGERSHDMTVCSEGSSRGRLQTPELPPSPGKHSTPYPAKKDTLHDSLFGFEALESPLVLTPLALSPVKTARDCNIGEHTQRRDVERHRQHWRSSAAVTTVHAGPKQRHKPRNKAPEPSEQEDWIKRMNEEFGTEEFKRFRSSRGEFAADEVIDFENVQRFGASQIGVSNMPAPLSACNLAAHKLGLLPVDKWKVFTLASAPGLYVIPNPFREGGQHHWVKQCLVTYPCKPNVCNLDAHVVRTGDGRLWPRELGPSAAEMVVSRGIQEVSKDVSEVSKDVSEAEVSKDVSKMPNHSDLLHKLHWVTLGYHYDWTAKVYHMEHRSPFPEDMAKLSTFILDVAGFPNFVPEAAIVNYYNLGSTLSGHTDHSEQDLSRPLLSISFGQSAMFLIGGATKQVRPKAILLRSGDVIIMSGACRLAYHGVPKIVPPHKGMEIPRCLSQDALQLHLEGLPWCLCGEAQQGPDTVHCLSCSRLLDSWPDMADSTRDQEERIKQELSEVTLGELQTIQTKIGSKKFDVVLQSESSHVKKKPMKRANKNRPREMSSKKPVPQFREVVELKKREQRLDPRFDEQTGTLNKEMFKKAYGFLDDIQQREKQALQKTAKKTRNPNTKERAQRLLQRMESQKAAEEKEASMKALQREHRRTEAKLISKGKKPFYLKKATQKKIELVQKYSELKKLGKVDEFIRKKRKKNASRDRKQMPTPRE
eukprot:Em0019g268a